MNTRPANVSATRYAAVHAAEAALAAAFAAAEARLVEAAAAALVNNHSA